MRVTKIIREYVEQTVGNKYNVKINELHDKRQTAMSDNYREFSEVLSIIVENAVDNTMQEMKRLQIDMYERPAYSKKDDKEFIKECFIRGMRDILHYTVNTERNKIDDDIQSLYDEKKEKINNILIGIEIGDIDKKKLDEVLEPYK